MSDWTMMPDPVKSFTEEMCRQGIHVGVNGVCACGNPWPCDADTIKRVAAEHIMRRPWCCSSWSARDKCDSESRAFAAALADAGVEASVVSGFHLDNNVVLEGHFAVRIRDKVWDMTARQFDSGADVPLVTPWDEWRSEWMPLPEGAANA